MKLVTFQPSSADHAAARRNGALLADGRVLDFQHPACAVPAPLEPLGWYELDGATLRAARALLDDAPRLERVRAGGAALSAESVRLGPPVPRPSKVICIGLNYRDHAIESGMAIPERPLVFSKFPSSVIGPDDTIRLPEDSHEVDYEAELGVVIGRRVARCTRAEAAAAVLGYMNLNDVSARDFQFADGQWQRGKACDTFCPTGPYLATADEVPDPHALRIRCRVDGVTLQDSSTAQLIFGVPEIVEYLARTITLEPGDVIATGTPPGVGFARKPPVWLERGSRVEIEVEGLGVLANPVG
jgi:2-keto-4-pentenoate hydratase/2-oxohepta-3-ene-1,7-dioic acid hydratase in catechol pathway